MVWLPAASAEVLIVAPPPLSVTAGPSEVLPSVKVTVPVGVPPGPDTVAVNVTGCPNVLEVGEEVSAVVVPALLTTCGLPVSDPVLVAKVLSPP